nr:GABA transporter 1-like [Tanacetum cinerariifolium]
GEGSGTPTEPHHTPSSEVQQTSSTTHSSPTLPPVTTAPIPTVTPSDTPPLRQYTRRTRIAQSLVLPPVADEPASSLRDVSQCEACPTDSGFEADQDRTNIAKSSTLPHESTSRVTSLAADEGSMQHKLDELTALCSSLQRQHSEIIARFEAQGLEIKNLNARIKVLEDKDRGVAEQYRDDALIKGRRLDVEEEAAERVSDDTEDMATVLTSMDPATVLASGVAEVPTSSGSIPTAGPPAAEVPTGSDVVPTAESETPKKKKVQEQIDAQVARELEEQLAREDQRMFEQIARDAEIARIHAEEELQIMIDGLDRSNETVAKYLQEYHQFATELPIERRIELIRDLVRYQDNYAKVHKYQTQQRNPRSKKQKRDYYMEVIKSNLGWKVKDFRGITFEEIEAKFTTVWKQIKNFIPMGSKEESERFKRKGIRFEQESVKKLKTSEEHLDNEDLNQLWALVKESLNIRPASSDKEMKLWVELKRLYEPDVKDQLWTHTQNMMHAPVEWKLYDLCGVHHVTSKDNEIFMLIEKDYPLRKGLAIVMISYKLQVENYSQMANDLILKIYKIANCPIMEFPLLGEVPTTSEESSHCQKKREATAVKIALLLNSRRNCQSKSYDSYANTAGKGSWKHAAFHVATTIATPAAYAPLPFAVASLGWPLGVISLVGATLTTWYSSNLIASLWKWDGKKHTTYRHLAHSIYGSWGYWSIAFFQQVASLGNNIAIQIAAGSCLKAVYKYYHEDGSLTLQHFIIFFGIFELVLSQLPNIHSLRWLNAICTFSTIGFAGTTIGVTIYNGKKINRGIVSHSLQGSSSSKMFKAFNGLGVIAFSFGDAMLPEIQSTIREPVKKTMYKVMGCIGAVKFITDDIRTYKFFHDM